MRHLVTKGLFMALLSIFMLEAFAPEAQAQGTRLAGTVTDARTNNPVPGATVLLVGTDQGAAADVQGRYSILGISPGTYTLRVSAIGYATLFVEGVLVTTDRTTTQNVQLTEEVIEGQEVTVEAIRPVVDPNQTSSRTLVTSEEIAVLPVSDLQQVIARTSNAYEGFIRGSRRFETRTIIEGIDISDAFYDLQNKANAEYAGQAYRNTNKADRVDASIFSINPEGISEVTVNTGAVDPRYASATGGVVAVSLSERRGPLTGSFSARIAPSIARPGPDSLAFYFDAESYFAERDALAAEGDAKAQLYTWTPDRYKMGEDPEMDFRGTIGGSLTDDWSFQFSGQWFQTNGFMPNEFRRRANGQLRSTYNLTPSTSLTAVGLFEDRGMWGNWQNRSYQEIWRFHLDAVAENDGGAYLGSLQLRHVLSDDSYVTAQVYRTYQRMRYGYTDDDGNWLDFTHPQVVRDYIGMGGDRTKRFYETFGDSDSETSMLAPDNLRYRLRNPVPYSEDATSTTNGFRIDYANQLTHNHFLQFGSELKLRNFDYSEVYGVDTGVKLNPEEEPFIPRDWTRSPWELSFYASDRMEYGGLVVNLGLRTDLINRHTEYFENHFQPLVRDTIETTHTMADGSQLTRRLARNRANRGESVPLDFFVNPSIGVSHPIGERAAMYFSYSRNRQLVPYSQLYQLYDGNHSTSQFMTLADPGQDPVTSNNYELGLQWEFFEGWGADVNTYMRSIDNYGQITFVANVHQPGARIPSQAFYSTSFGYAETRGVEFVLRRRPLELGPDVRLGLTASYTFASVHQAYNAGGNTTVFSYQAPEPGEEEATQLPFDNVRQFRHFVQNVRGGGTLTSGYDRTHRGVVRALANLPYQFTVGLTGSLESGFLYPRALGADPRGRDLLTGPTNHQIDLRIENRFNLGGRAGVDLFIDVRNVTNAQNIVAYEAYRIGGVEHFQTTGIPGSRLVAPDGTTLYGEARNVYFGTRVRF